MKVTNGSKLIRDPNLQIVFSVTLIAVMGVSSITPAFPLIIREFGITEQEVGLLITAFTLPGVLLTLPLGVLSDRYGRKRILVPSLFLFGIAGVSCTVADSFGMLLVLRFVQGFGAAALGSLNVTILADLYKGKERATAMGYNASVLNIGTASYPAIGGALAVFGWFYPFYLPLFAIPIGILAIIGLRNPEPDGKEDLKRYLSKTWRVIANRKAIALFVASAFTLLVLYGSYLTFFPLLLDENFAADSLMIGVVMSLMSLATAVTASQLGRLSIKHEYTTLLKISYPFFILGLGLVPFIPDLYLFIIPMIIFGIGNGINMPSINTLLAELSPMESRGAFMSLNGFVLRLGQTIGPLLMATIFAVGSFAGVFLTGAGLLLFALILVSVLLKDQDADSRKTDGG